MSISWDQATEEKFKQLIAKMPIFVRDTAKREITRKAESLVAKDNRRVITEKDMVDAFFAETPFGFQGMMKNDLSLFGIDYIKYGYDK